MANPKARMIQFWVTVFILSIMIFFPGKAQATGWTIQVRSCLTQPEADGVIKNLEAYGLKPEVAFEQAGDKGMRYRVLVGHFDGRNAAEIYAQELKTSGIVKDYWIKPASSGGVYKGPGNHPEPPLENEYLGGGSIDDNPVVYPPMPGRTGVNPQGYPQNQGPYAQVYPNPAPGAPCAPGATGCPPPMAPPVQPAQAFHPGMAGPCTGTAHPAGNQVILDDQPPMSACDSYSPNLYYLPNSAPQQRKGAFAGIRAGVMIWPNAEDFEIVHSKNGVITTWKEDYSVVPRVSLFTGYRFNNFFAMEIALDLPQTYEWKSWFLSFSPKLMYPMPGTNIVPYIKGGPVIGSLTWSDAPGGFDETMGWEVGGGMDIELADQFTLEAGAAYRNIVFKYNEPINTVTPHGDLDMSGYSVDVSFRYRF